MGDLQVEQCLQRERLEKLREEWVIDHYWRFLLLQTQHDQEQPRKALYVDGVMTLRQLCLDCSEEAILSVQVWVRVS